MSVPRTVADVIKDHVSLELESLDRVYLNVYQPKLQTPKSVYYFLRQNYGQGAVSSIQMKAITERFLRNIEDYVYQNQIPMIHFEKNQRKEDVAAEYLEQSNLKEGVLFIGISQEKVRTFQTTSRQNSKGQIYPWIVETTKMVNQYYFYAVDEDFGMFFLKYSSYIPYGAKLCFNGHEYIKCQLRKEGIDFHELENGILSCANPQRLKEIADGLSPARIANFHRKWMNLLPSPFTRAQRLSGYNYEISMSQIEMSLTQVVDRPTNGRIFFEEVIRENLDLGRPDNIQLIFKRRVTKRTPGAFRTRVINSGVIPSIHVDYKSNRLKQYFKEGKALRTELTVNNPRDFGIGRKLGNLPELRELGFQANRRLLNVQSISQDFIMSEDLFQEVNNPRRIDDQRASAIRFGDPKVLAILSALLIFRLLPCGFRSKDLREHVAPLLGDDPNQWTQGRLTYQLRRLRLHGLIERMAKTNRYMVTERGFQVALWFSRCHSRLFRPALGVILPKDLPEDKGLRIAFKNLEREVDRYIVASKMQPEG